MSPAAETWPEAGVYVHNCAIRDAHVTMPAQELIATMPRGAYTTLRIREGYLALDWQIHLCRLVKSSAAMDAALDGAYHTYYQHIFRGVVGIFTVDYDLSDC